MQTLLLMFESMLSLLTVLKTGPSKTGPQTKTNCQGKLTALKNFLYRDAYNWVESLAAAC